MENKMTGLDFKIREVAGRIRELREVNGLSIEDMAQRTGLTVEEYCKQNNINGWVADLLFTYDEEVKENREILESKKGKGGK